MIGRLWTQLYVFVISIGYNIITLLVSVALTLLCSPLVNNYINLTALAVWILLFLVLDLLIKSENKLIRVPLLLSVLTIGSFILLLAKAEQYMLLYILTEFGTLLFIFSVFKGSSNSRKASYTTHRNLLILQIPALLLYTSALDNFSYWAPNYEQILCSCSGFTDFYVLKVIILDNFFMNYASLLILVIIITLFIVGIKGCVTRFVLPTKSAYASFVLKNLQAFNSIKEQKLKSAKSDILKM